MPNSWKRLHTWKRTGLTWTAAYLDVIMSIVACQVWTWTYCYITWHSMYALCMP